MTNKITVGQIDSWETRVHEAYRDGTLPDAYRRELEAIPGWKWRKQRAKQTIEEHVAIAEERARNNGGILENPKWLFNNGFVGLFIQMKKHPDRFAHIPQHEPVKLTKSTAEWVKIAEDVAAESGGVLPIPFWLSKNGFGALVQAMRRTPDTFKHIPQKRTNLSADEWVVIARARAAANGGVLESKKCLAQKGLHGLLGALSSHPDMFADIKQDQPHEHFRTGEEWVAVAEERAKGNGGMLENTGWLMANGFSGLSRMMIKKPELFSHIQQHKKKMPAAMWVPIAEARAQANGGLLESVRWLSKNGLSGLQQQMHKRPELFAHIPQEKPQGDYKTPEEWVAIAEARARTNRGMLESVTWLNKNGFSGLPFQMRKCPELFAHIAQEKPNSQHNSAEMWVPIAEARARANGGMLESGSWLGRNGLSQLPKHMMKRPELFAHIPQTKTQAARKRQK